MGRFWAYFPLQDVTSARGIHNAPWRINDDRTNMLDGRFNEELLDVIADMLGRQFPQVEAMLRDAQEDLLALLSEESVPETAQTHVFPRSVPSQL